MGDDLQIKISTKPWATDLWFTGNITVKGKEYSFDVSDKEHEEVCVVNWSDMPMNRIKLEKQIIEKYIKR